MTITKVGVVGAGLMGSGIAQVSAAGGYETVVREVSRDLLDKGLSKITASLDRSVSKGKATIDQKEETLKRLSGTTVLEDLCRCDLVIEAVTEDIAVKKELFSALDGICQPAAIFATNTSSLTVTEMAAVTRRPHQFVGLHFFNPVPIMRLVEVVRTIQSSPSTLDRVFRWVQSVNKIPIACKDNSGFVVNLLLVPYLLGAIRAVERGIASIEDIDQGMSLGCGHPMGPLTLLDFVGLDTVHSIANIMFDEYREAQYAPPPLLRKLVQAGHHGRKSGRGFYVYGPGKPIPAELGL